ncbi:GNAT family N-acetyltransferase (plasmid) [Rhizobium leguminosarum]|nr:GNAT family N-acetyltransferase [Rhizobium leguminosarum]TAV46586.1 GNAT family N-acetyltransferase [Rhizobium leguminosarum]
MARLWTLSLDEGEQIGTICSSSPRRTNPGVCDIGKHLHALPVFGFVEADVVTALMALEPDPPGAVEIALIAKRPEHHRRGAGRHLIVAAERFGHESGARPLTVKTLAPRDRDEPQFEANGFVRAEVFAKLWHEDHPCLFMVKPLADVEATETAL